MVPRLDLVLELTCILVLAVRMVTRIRVRRQITNPVSSTSPRQGFVFST